MLGVDFHYLSSLQLTYKTQTTSFNKDLQNSFLKKSSEVIHQFVFKPSFPSTHSMMLYEKSQIQSFLNITLRIK